MKKVVALRNPPDVAYESELLSTMEDVEFVAVSPINEQVMTEAVKDADVILYTATPITAELIEKMQKCKLIIRYGIGYDNIDLAKAAEKGIFVCNAPNYGVVDVAEHALALMMAAAKNLLEMYGRVEAGNWSGKNLAPAVRMAGKTVGFVGFGNIGRTVCARTNAFAMKALVYVPL